jgi:pimeloyl-ACP methyl ester carboxylesterase
MTTMREGAVRCLDPHGFHWMRYTEWGDERNPRVLLCVHGLTRNGRDFDMLAEGLADAYRVVCPDVVGRGRSDWLRDSADYTYPVYLNDLNSLMAKVGAETVDWVGTSMGGILGMILASVPGTPVRKLVLNDVGCEITKVSLERIGKYLGMDPPFASLEAIEAEIRRVSPFGPLTDEQWRHMALHSSKQGEDGKYRFRYDPGIARNFHAAPLAAVNLRPYWNQCHGPVLVVRGEHSDLLAAETLEEMKRRPHTEALVVRDTGHAPMLMSAEQIGAVRHFLLT